MALLLGNPALGANSANSNAAGQAFAMRVQARASGTVTVLRLRTGPTVPTAGNTHGAIYADAAGEVTGAARLSGDVTITAVASAVNTFAISPGVPVVVGVFYWLEFLGVGTALSYTDFQASPGAGTTRDTASALTVLAATHPATTASFTNIFNAYADGDLVSRPDYSQFPKAQLRSVA